MVGFSSPFDPIVRDRLLHQLARAYPGFPPESVEDAVQDALLCVVRRPPAGGPAGLTPLVYHIAWRRLRGEWRRRRVRPEASAAVRERGPVVGAGQEVATDAKRLARAMLWVLKDHGGCHRDALEAALWEKIASGDSDVDLARRHGFPRERLNRAWSALLNALGLRGG